MRVTVDGGQSGPAHLLLSAVTAGKETYHQNCKVHPVAFEHVSDSLVVKKELVHL